MTPRYGSGSGSFYKQTKIVRKTLIFTVFCLLYYFLYLKTELICSFHLKSHWRKYQRVEGGGRTFKGEGCKDDYYTYNGMRVVGDGAADPLDLHQDQNKRHHSQRPRQHHKCPAKLNNITIKIKTLQGSFYSRVSCLTNQRPYFLIL